MGFRWHFRPPIQEIRGVLTGDSGINRRFMTIRPHRKQVEKTFRIANNDVVDAKYLGAWTSRNTIGVMTRESIGYPAILLAAGCQ